MFSFAYQRLKKYQYSTIIPLSLTAIDFGVILMILELFGYTRFAHGIGMQSYLLLSVNMALCWILAGFFTGAYQIENLGMARKIILRSTLASVIYFGLVIVLMGLRSGSEVHLSMLLALCFLTVVTIVVVRMLMLRLYRMIRHMAANRKNAIIIGNTLRGKELSRFFLTSTSLPQQYLGFFDHIPPTHNEELPFYIGGLDKVKSYCLENNVKEIYYALDYQKPFLTELTQFTDEHFIFLGIIPDVDGLDFSRRVDTILYNDSRIPVISSRKVPLQIIVNGHIKRAFDIVFSAFVLIILFLTIFPLIAIAIKLSSPGPVLFKQLRPGRDNQLFWCYKFRTMKVNSDGQKQATKNDSRITKVGAFLRKTSWDELPQFYNVLIGDMSVVGPRPNLIVHLQEYPKEIKEYPLRHWITPGITGYAQINGYRGETRETFLMRKRVEYDLLYIENWSLSLDIKIIGKTVLNMLKGEDSAY